MRSFAPLLLSLICVGCSSSEPSPAGEQPAAGAQPAAEPEQSPATSPQREFEQAAEELGRKLTQAAAEGWPESLGVTDGKPLVDIGDVTNRTTQLVDLGPLVQELRRTLGASDAVNLEPGPGAVTLILSGELTGGRPEQTPEGAVVRRYQLALYLLSTRNGRPVANLTVRRSYLLADED
jgi:hypothetical protein